MIPIFVGGTGRCGTTLLRRCLGHSPDVSHLRGEFRLVTDPGGLIDLYDALVVRWTPGRGHQALKRFQALVERRSSGRDGKYNLDAWGGGGGWVHKRVNELVGDLSYHETGSHFYETEMMAAEDAAVAMRRFVCDFYERAHPGSKAFVDDTPDSVPLASWVRRIFPKARIVWVVRDPRDVLASFNAVYAKGRWTSDTTETNARRIAGVLDRCFVSLCDASVRLEWLVEAPADVLAGLCKGLGVAYQDAAVSEVTPNLAHIGRWQSELTADEAGLLGAYVKRLGYDD